MWKIARTQGEATMYNRASPRKKSSGKEPCKDKATGGLYSDKQRANYGCGWKAWFRPGVACDVCLREIGMRCDRHTGDTLQWIIDIRGSRIQRIPQRRKQWWVSEKRASQGWTSRKTNLRHTNNQSTTWVHQWPLVAGDARPTWPG